MVLANNLELKSLLSALSPHNHPVHVHWCSSVGKQPCWVPWGRLWAAAVGMAQQLNLDGFSLPKIVRKINQVENKSFISRAFAITNIRQQRCVGVF